MERTPGASGWQLTVISPAQVPPKLVTHTSPCRMGRQPESKRVRTMLFFFPELRISVQVLITSWSS